MHNINVEIAANARENDVHFEHILKLQLFSPSLAFWLSKTSPWVIINFLETNVTWKTRGRDNLIHSIGVLSWKASYKPFDKSSEARTQIDHFLILINTNLLSIPVLTPSVLQPSRPESVKVNKFSPRLDRKSKLAEESSLRCLKWIVAGKQLWSGL